MIFSSKIQSPFKFALQIAPQICPKKHCFAALICWSLLRLKSLLKSLLKRLLKSLHQKTQRILITSADSRVCNFDGVGVIHRFQGISSEDFCSLFRRISINGF